LVLGREQSGGPSQDRRDRGTDRHPVGHARRSVMLAWVAVHPEFVVMVAQSFLSVLFVTLRGPGAVHVRL
jgi:hypothetical protein